MKRIIFYIKHKPSPVTRLSFALRMLLRGVKVSYCKEDATVNYDTDNLYVTDEEFASVDQLASRVSMTIYGLKKSLEEKIKNQNIIINPE